MLLFCVLMMRRPLRAWRQRASRARRSLPMPRLVPRLHHAKASAGGDLEGCIERACLPITGGGWEDLLRGRHVPEEKTPADVVGADIHARLCKGVLDIACGLQELHRHGFLVNDLKPSNVLVYALDFVERGARKPCELATRRKWRWSCQCLKIADLGLSTDWYVDEFGVARAGPRIGTPLYMAPEVKFGLRTGDVLTKASDSWLWGATAAETLRLRLEPDDFDAKGCARAVADLAPYSLELRDLVERCLSESPNARPPIDEIISIARAGLHEALLLQAQALSARSASLSAASARSSAAPSSALQ